MDVTTTPTPISPIEQWIPPLERAIRRVCSRRRMSAPDAEDFRSFALLQLLRDDARRLRGFRGESSRAVFLAVVVRRLYLDFRTASWGKWRCSARARRLGDLAVELETLLYRDGISIEEATEVLVSRRPDCASGSTVRELATRLPARSRPRPRFVSAEITELAVPAGGNRPDLARETAEAEGLLLRGFRQAASALSAEERALLKNRFAEGRKMRSVAAERDTSAARIYGRLRRALRKLRKELERRGVGYQTVECLIDGGGVQVDLLRWLS